MFRTTIFVGLGKSVAHLPHVSLLSAAIPFVVVHFGAQGLVLSASALPWSVEGFYRASASLGQG